jgi:hypothetical protein
MMSPVPYVGKSKKYFPARQFRVSFSPVWVGAVLAAINLKEGEVET